MTVGSIAGNHPAPAPAPQASQVASAIEEAKETPDVTRREAARGDRVAQRKLAQEESARAGSGETAKTEPPGSGDPSLTPVQSGHVNVVA